MKFRDSDMPNQEMWEDFFNPEYILQTLEVANDIENYIDIGCGYGTFLIPASEMISGIAIGVDIDEKYLEVCRSKIEAHSLKNIYLVNGDVSQAETFQRITKIAPKVDYISLFNILHCEEPSKLLKDTRDVLRPGGKIGVIHWIHGNTPRGPKLDIRPKPDMIVKWATDIELIFKKQVNLPPYHFGLVFEKQA